MANLSSAPSSNSARKGRRVTAFMMRPLSCFPQARIPSGSMLQFRSECDGNATVVASRRPPHLDGEEQDRPASPLKPSIRSSRSEEHTSELQSLMRISYAVFCLKKKNQHH